MNVLLGMKRLIGFRRARPRYVSTSFIPDSVIRDAVDLNAVPSVGHYAHGHDLIAEACRVSLHELFRRPETRASYTPCEAPRPYE